MSYSPLVKTFSYIIESGSYGYSARSGNTGKVVYTGSDAATVINGALNSTITGQKIFFKPGWYILTAPIVINKCNVTLEGEVSGRFSINPELGVIFYTTGSDVDAIQISGSSNGTISNIHIKNIKFGNGDWPYPWMSGHGITNKTLHDEDAFINSSIRNCFFQGYQNERYAIDIKNYENVVISECFLYTCTGSKSALIHIYSTGYSSSSLTIEDSEIAPETSGSWGILVESCPSNRTGSYSGSPQGCGRLYFVRNHIAGGGGTPGVHGVKLVAENEDMARINFTKTSFEACDLYISGSVANSKRVFDVYLYDNYMIFDGATSNLDYMIYIGAQCGAVQILNNHLDNLLVTSSTIYNRASWSALYPVYVEGCTLTGYAQTYIDSTGGYIEYGNNFGWEWTQYRGYQSINSASGSFAHGMVGPPRYINITPSGSSYMGSLQAWPSGSAGIWVQQTGSGTVGFYIEARM